MSDQSFREIQLSGKQLVFLFMSAVVVAVVIFLLGVQVGRGVRATAPESVDARLDAGAATDTTVPADLPPPTTPAPGDFGYHGALQAQDPAAKSVPPPPPSAEAPPQTAASGSSSAANAKSAEPPRAAESNTAKPPASGPPAAASAPSRAEDRWFVQVFALGSRASADRQVAALKSRGYAAFVHVGAPEPRFKVRIGPFAARAEADRIAARLAKEGTKSSVIR